MRRRRTEKWGKKAEKEESEVQVQECPTPAPTEPMCAASLDNTKYAKDVTKLHRQCRKKCNPQARRRVDLTKCKQTCHKCNDFCSCTAPAMTKKTKQKMKKGKGAKYNKQEDKWGRRLQGGAH